MEVNKVSPSSTSNLSGTSSSHSPQELNLKNFLAFGSSVNGELGIQLNNDDHIVNPVQSHLPLSIKSSKLLQSYS